MSSFYGGKQGRTYNIVKQYASVQEMVNCFQQGGSYSEVNYGQYVLIDTEKKNNPQNGIIYRRGFNYTQGISDDIKNPGGGAIYVGQIVGPQGESPEVIPVAWSAMSTAATVNAVNGSASKGKQIIIDPDTEQETIQYNDQIRIASFTDRDDYDNVEGAQIAFDIPTTIFQATALNSTATLGKVAITENPSSTAHPFYYNWDFNIPQATKFQIETAVQENPSEGQFIAENQNVNGKYITYSVQGGQIQSSHLGRWPYKVIDNITGTKKEIEEFYMLEQILEGFLPKFGQVICAIDDSRRYNYLICIQEGEIEAGSTIPGLNFSLGDEIKIGNSEWRAIKILERSQYGTKTPQEAYEENFPYASLSITYQDKSNDTTIPTRFLDNLIVSSNNQLYASYSDLEDPVYITTLNYPRDFRIFGDVEPEWLERNIKNNPTDGDWYLAEGFEKAEVYINEEQGWKSLPFQFAKGWIVTISEEDPQTGEINKRFKAYDYRNSEWYEVGLLSASNVTEPKYVIDIDENNEVKTGGFVFNLTKGHNHINNS